jgi:hypothetical protein
MKSETKSRRVPLTKVVRVMFTVRLVSKPWTDELL